MNNEKGIAFVIRVCDLTMAGKLKWEVTPAEGAFQTQIGSFIVRFITVGASDDAAIMLYDSKGQSLDTFHYYNLSDIGTVQQTVRRRMVDAYQAARRQAKGVDKALDELLGELGKG